MNPTLQGFWITFTRFIEVLSISIPAFVLIGLVMWWFSEARRKAPTLRSAVEMIFPRRVYTSPGFKVDLLHMLLSITFWLRFLGIVFALWAGMQIDKLLVAQFGPAMPWVQSVWAVVLLQSVVVILARDFGFYLGHFVTHAVPFVWRVHRSHHSAEGMSVFTSYRLHPLDRAVVRVFHTSAAALATGAVLYISGGKLAPGTMAVLGVWSTMISIKTLFDHGNFWVSYGKLDWIVCSPAMHQVHHSAQVRHWDKNMGEVFAIWDWMFGTIYVPSRQREVHQLGTRDSEIGTANPHRTLWGFYWEPIRTMADMLRHPRLAYFSLQSTRHDEATLAADSAQYPSAAGLLPLPVGPGASAGATLHR